MSAPFILVIENGTSICDELRAAELPRLPLLLRVGSPAEALTALKQWHWLLILVDADHKTRTLHKLSRALEERGMSLPIVPVTTTRRKLATAVPLSEVAEIVRFHLRRSQ